MKTFPALLTTCAGNSPVIDEFPAQMPVTWSFDVFFDLRLNKRLSKQSWGWWLETPSGSLWRHYNVIDPYNFSYSYSSRLSLYALWLYWRQIIGRMFWYISGWIGLIRHATAIHNQCHRLWKSSRHWPLCGEFSVDRWIPRKKGQWRGKCFHLMTSSW